MRLSSRSTPGMSSVEGIALLTRKRSATRIGSTFLTSAFAMRSAWICASIASASFASSALFDRCGEINEEIARERDDEQPRDHDRDCGRLRKAFHHEVTAPDLRVAES